MKIAKKLLAVVMALAMIAALTAVAFAASASFATVDNGDGTVTVTVKLVDAVGLKSGKLVFSYDENKITEIKKKNGTDVKNIGDIDNSWSNEFNAKANADKKQAGEPMQAEYGFFFKDVLWDSAKWAAAEGFENPINGESFEAAVFTFAYKEASTVTVTGNLVIGENSVPVNETFKVGTVVHKHTLVKTDAKAATCTEDGTKEYYTCSECNKMFSDAAGTKEITAPEKVPAGHKPDGGKVTRQPTCTKKGVTTVTCTVCGAVISEKEDIPMIAHNYGSDGKCTMCGAAKPTTPVNNEKEYDIDKNNNGKAYVCPCGNKECKCDNEACKCDGKNPASKCTDAKCPCNCKPAADKPTEKAAANNGNKTAPKTDGGKNTGDNSVLAIMAGVIALAGAAYVATKKRK